MKVHSYININNNLRYFLTTGELYFLIHLKQLSFLRLNGYRTAYSLEYNLLAFQLNKNLFYKIAKRLEYLGLLERVQIGKFTDYILVEGVYKRLVEIASSTNNIKTLISFSENEFKLKNRKITDIKDIEILLLKSNS